MKTRILKLVLQVFAVLALVTTFSCVKSTPKVDDLEHSPEEESSEVTAREENQLSESERKDFLKRIVKIDDLEFRMILNDKTVRPKADSECAELIYGFLDSFEDENAVFAAAVSGSTLVVAKTGVAESGELDPNEIAFLVIWNPESPVFSDGGVSAFPDGTCDRGDSLFHFAEF